ncbi:hypothetical protein [Saccharopolyspora shandongensis]|uniref:hypothetical protein n=1 Tax=Saccharopolyspora shandongensis TaxID=418495 RepID=UPI0033E99CC4
MNAPIAPPAPATAKTPHLHFALTFFLYGPIGTGLLLLIAVAAKIHGLTALVFAIAAIGPLITLIAWAVAAHFCREENDNRQRLYANAMAQYNAELAGYQARMIQRGRPA